MIRVSQCVKYFVRIILSDWETNPDYLSEALVYSICSTYEAAYQHKSFYACPVQ